MSKLLKSIGKVFKKIVKVVKKFALPILAIGAIVLTGGAALGLALPSLGSVGTTSLRYRRSPNGLRPRPSEVYCRTITGEILKTWWLAGSTVTRTQWMDGLPKV